MAGCPHTLKNHRRYGSPILLLILVFLMTCLVTPSLLFAKKGKGGGGNGGGNTTPVVVPPPAPAPAPTPVVDPVPAPPPPGPAPFVPSALTGPNFGDVTLPPAERPQALSLWHQAPSGLSNIPPTLVLVDLNSGELLNLGHHGFDWPQTIVLMNDRLLVGGEGPLGADLLRDGELWDFTQLPGSLVGTMPRVAHPAPRLAVDPISGNLFHMQPEFWSGSHLSILDPVTAALTPVGNSLIGTCNDLAINPAGAAHCIGRALPPPSNTTGPTQDTVFSLDLTTGALTNVAPLSLPFSASAAIDFDSLGNLWMVENHGSRFYHVDPLTGAMTLKSHAAFNGRSTGSLDGLAILAPGLGSADLAITATASANIVQVGDLVEYTLTVTNNGTAPVPNAIAAMPVPFELAYRPDLTVGDCHLGPVSHFFSHPEDGWPQLSCNLGPIAPGASVDVIVGADAVDPRTIIIESNPLAPGEVVVQAVTAGHRYDPLLTNNVSLATINVIPRKADLSVTKNDFPDPVEVGGTLTYELTVTNNGPNIATGVVLTDTLPSGVTLLPQLPGSLCVAGSTVTCNLGELLPQQSVVETIRVVPQSSGVLVNTAQVNGNEIDPLPANNIATAQTTVNGDADLTGNISRLRVRENKGEFRFDFNVIVENIGGGPTNQSFTVQAWLSSDAVVDAGDTLLSAWTVPAGLGAGLDVQLSDSVKKLAATPTGFFLLVVDSENTIQETVETNNSASQQIQ